MRTRLLTLLLALVTLTAVWPIQAHDVSRSHDAAGRPILRGPLPSGNYHGVRIISDTVGVNAIQATSIVDSVIEAPICVISAGHDLVLRNNILDCELCLEFTEGLLMNLKIADNQCNGRGTNRPDILRW